MRYGPKKKFHKNCQTIDGILRYINNDGLLEACKDFTTPNLVDIAQGKRLVR